MYIFIDNKRSSSVQYSVHCQVLFQLFYVNQLLTRQHRLWLVKYPLAHSVSERVWDQISIATNDRWIKEALLRGIERYRLPQQKVYDVFLLISQKGITQLMTFGCRRRDYIRLNGIWKFQQKGHATVILYLFQV